MKYFLLIFFLVISTTCAQTDTTNSARDELHTFDVHLGVPLGGAGAVLLGGSYAYSHHLIQVRYLIITQSLKEQALLYGYKFKPGKRALSSNISVGIGHLKGDYIDYADRINNSFNLSEYGLALRVETIYPGFEFFGGGISLHANINPERSVGAFSITFYLGKLY